MTLGLLIAKAGPGLKPFVPQLQVCLRDRCLGFHLGSHLRSHLGLHLGSHLDLWLGSVLGSRFDEEQLQLLVCPCDLVYFFRAWFTIRFRA